MTLSPKAIGFGPADSQQLISIGTRIISHHQDDDITGMVIGMPDFADQGKWHDFNSRKQDNIPNLKPYVLVGPNSFEIGIFNANGSSFVIGSSVVAENRGIQWNDVAGAFNSTGGNLIGENLNSLGFTDTVIPDLVGSLEAPIDSLLAPLADNGGYVLSHRPLAGSPVLDAGNYLDERNVDIKGTQAVAGNAATFTAASREQVLMVGEELFRRRG